MDRINDPRSFVHRFAETNGMRLHYVEEGEGPLVLLLHGFPYLWYAWRHQIRALAREGYRVIAPDLPGFGRSDCPAALENYELLHVVGDLVDLMNALEESSAVIVGHDLGAWIAQACALLRPDLFRALVMLNTPVGPREPQRPSETWRKLRAATGKRLHHDYFQEPGVADRLMNADVGRTLRGIHYSVSGEARPEERWRPLIADGETILDTVADPARLPAWMPQDALDCYASEYERHGFTGPLNYYRCRDRNWEQTAFVEGLRVHQPTLFIGGAADPGLEHFAPIYDGLECHYPNLRRKILLEGVGHDAAEERPEVVSYMLADFLNATATRKEATP